MLNDEEFLDLPVHFPACLLILFHEGGIDELVDLGNIDVSVVGATAGIVDVPDNVMWVEEDL